MTNHNNTREKANAVFFSVIMVLSMVAVGFAAAPAAAEATGLSNATADDVAVGETGVSQDVSFDVTVNNSTTANIDVNLSAAVSAGVSPAIDNVTVTGTDVSLDGGNGAINSDVHEFNVSDGGNSTSNNTATVNVTYTHDTTGVATSAIGNSVDFPISADSGVNDTATFTLVPSSSAERQLGEDFVYNGSFVYQGEDDLTFIDDDGTKPSAGSLQKTSGDSQGTSLQLPISDNAATGTYENNAGFSVIVQEPRITTSEVRLDGSDVSQIASSRADDLDIYAEWNFDEAENISTSVEDPNGDTITDEVVEGPSVLSGSGSSTTLDLSTEDTGEYTVIFEGNDSLDQDSVVEEYTIETTSQDQLSLETAEDSVTRGDNLGYTVSGGANGVLHVVAVQSDDFREGADNTSAAGIFRNVQDVDSVGVWNGTDGSQGVNDVSDASYAYAVVEIDGTTAAGSIETQYLDDASIDVDIYEESSPANVSGLTSADDVSFDVNEGEVSLDSPTDTYTVGSEVDINGSAQSADNVAIYARDNSDWELLDIDGDSNTDSDDYISVDSDDSFEEEDVRLSSASNIYSFEGQYDIGVVDVSDLSGDTSTLTTSEFSSASNARYTLQVEPGDLTAEFGTINGQIADTVDDDIDVSGTAAGQEEVVIAFVGQRGDTQTTTASVDSDDTFEEDDISLSDISQGTVSGHVISPGRDGSYGNGDIGDNAQEVANAIDGYGSGSSGGDQIRSQIIANTVDDTGSDDLIVSSTFRLNDPTLSINNVYPDAAEAEGLNPVATGETLVVEGDTNRQADNAAITLELLTQEDDSVTSTSTDEWGNDGQFSATIDTSDRETGTYVLEADDGESTDRVTIEIVEERQDPDDGSDGDDGSDDGDDGSTDGDDGSTDGDDGGMDGDDGSTDGDDGGSDGEDGGSDGGDGGTDDSTPGFGALVALVALIAAALLATRRDN